MLWFVHHRFILSSSDLDLIHLHHRLLANVEKLVSCTFSTSMNEIFSVCWRSFNSKACPLANNYPEPLKCVKTVSRCEKWLFLFYQNIILFLFKHNISFPIIHWRAFFIFILSIKCTVNNILVRATHSWHWWPFVKLV